MIVIKMDRTRIANGSQMDRNQIFLIPLILLIYLLWIRGSEEYNKNTVEEKYAYIRRFLLIQRSTIQTMKLLDNRWFFVM
jgi:hypothetical protein